MSKHHNECPCGSQKLLVECCKPIHLNHASATHPEQLMRARYSAHVLGLVDFVVQTYHSSCEAEHHREAIAESINLTWLGLEVMNSEIAANGQGFVEFKACYKEAGEEYILQERSRFVQESINGQQYWFYIDGEYPQPPPSEQPSAPKPVTTAKTVGRNDPCLCGSGKKYKKCCG
ncbi:YchJ family metal-binding protein [Photobacterium sp. S4TG1]|uniref:YchJ family metal-binding protein n=1 Tax=Photobacterium sp. S4TG1 TaxID=3114587 RepID=UPI002E17A6E8|nr:YchJ family metal-binding protein [Photobacterium sp. S4TG1]